MKTMRHAMLTTLLAASLLACGDSSSPPPPFPDVAGTYSVSILLDGISASLAHGSGVLTIAQPSRQSGALTPSAQIVMDFGTGDAFTFTQVTNAAVTESGTISFRLIVPNPTSTWTYTGQLASSGQFISGTHVLSGSSVTTGTWTATKQ